MRFDSWSGIRISTGLAWRDAKCRKKKKKKVVTFYIARSVEIKITTQSTALDHGYMYDGGGGGGAATADCLSWIWRGRIAWCLYVCTYMFDR